MYSITDLGSLPGATSTAATGINSLGQVVGESGVLGQYVTPFLYSGGTMTALNGDIPAGISDTGKLALAMGGLNAFGINASGEEVGVVGPGVAATGVNGIVTPIPGTRGVSQANAINDAGEVVGFTQAAYTGDYHPFIYQNGKLTDIGASLPAGNQVAAFAVNNLGQVVGGAYNGPGHAFLYSDGKMTDLGTLGVGATSYATGINNFGQIIGYSALGNGYTDAFLYQNGKMIDLTMLVQSLGGLKIDTLVGIDNAGQIAFNAEVDGLQHAYLLNPEAVPEPSSLLLMGLGAAALIARQRRLKVRP